MAGPTSLRSKWEIKEVLKSEKTRRTQIKVDLVDENFTKLRGRNSRTSLTPYEEGRYQLEIKAPETSI
uniref:Uncharacterized protein n=1 Tax=Castor canadensis TaxID=51338 RepID=A0A8C0VXF6_CASCN